jgi:hypothetical protein
MVGDNEFGRGPRSIGDLPNAFSPDGTKDVADALEDDQRFILGRAASHVAQPPQAFWGSELLNAHIRDKCFEGFVATLAKFETSEVFDCRFSLRVEFSEEKPLYVSVVEPAP